MYGNEEEKEDNSSGGNDRGTHVVDAVDDGPHGEVAGSVYSLAVICWAPAGRVDVDDVGHVAHGVGFDEVRHERLVQHPQSCHRGQTHYSLSLGHALSKLLLVVFNAQLTGTVTSYYCLGGFVVRCPPRERQIRGSVPTFSGPVLPLT